MIKTYFKTAWRSMLKYKSFSFLKIAGLALGMAVCLLVIMIIRASTGFDTFHPDGDRVYRINTKVIKKGGGSEEYATSPYMVGNTLSSSYAGVESWTMLNSGFHKEITAAGRSFTLNMQFSNNDFFNLFGFTFHTGSANAGLTDPFSIVLTKSLSDKLFPDDDAYGQTVEITGVGLFKVTGVLNEFAGKTHLQFDALASFATIPTLEKENIIGKKSGDWINYQNNYTYVRLKPETDPAKFEAALSQIEKANYEGRLLDAQDTKLHFEIQPLLEIASSPALKNGASAGMDTEAILLFSLLAFVIMMSAAFNYTNLTIAKDMSRVKEIAVRKVIGSSRRHIFFQIITESVLTSLLALILAFVILQFLIPQFSSLGMKGNNSLNLRPDAAAAGIFVFFAIALGFFAGLFPATVLSRIKPLMLMQKLQNLKVFRHLGLRKSLLVIQFVISLIFITSVSILGRQMSYLIQLNFGTDQTQVYNIRLQDVDYEKAVNEFSRVPGVEKISAISTLMGSFMQETSRVQTEKGKEAIAISSYRTDENYIPNLNLRFAAGGNFQPSHAQKHEQYAIVNEKFLEQFRLGFPSEAIGKTIIADDSTRLVITGVLKDFLFRPADFAIEPLLLRYNPHKASVLNLTVKSGNMIQTTSQLKSVWNKLGSSQIFRGRFYKDDIENEFADMRSAVAIISFIGILGVIIACMGLLGITIFTVQSKTKELSIRKVVGASPFELVKLLTRSYVQVILISTVLAAPLTVIIAKELLTSSFYHLKISPMLFIPGFAAVVLLSLLTISFQTIKAALVNPINGLREE